MNAQDTSALFAQPQPAGTVVPPASDAASAPDSSPASRLEAQRREEIALVAGGVAHDLNNLLTGILGTAELLHDCDPAERDGLLREIRTTSLGAAQLCRNLLDLAGHGLHQPGPVDLAHLAAQMRPLLEASVRHRARLRFSVPAEPVVVMGEPAQLQQILLNLVVNARDASAHAAAPISVTLGTCRVDAAGLDSAALAAPEAAPGDYAFIEVADRGCGIPAGLRARLFEPFFTTKPSGRGIGLASIAGIVRGAGGLIHVHSEPGHGSVFRVALPVSGMPVTREPDHEAVTWAGQGRVLVADEDPRALRVTALLLRRLGFEVVCAQSADEAVALFEQRPASFAATVLDAGSMGADVVARFDTIRHGTPLLLLTGYPVDDAAERLGYDRGLFLQKPFLLASLARRLRALVGEHAAARPAAEPELPPAVELAAPAQLSEGEASVLDVHSVLNVINVLGSELQALAAQSGLPALSVFDLSFESQMLLQRGWDGGRLVARLGALESRLHAHLETVAAIRPEADQSEAMRGIMENVRDALRVLELRRLELEARACLPAPWADTNVAQLRDTISAFLEAAGRLAHDHCRTVYDPAARAPLDFLVQLDLRGLNGGPTIRLPLLLADVIRELTANSRRFTRAGGTIWVRLHERPECIHLAVTDTGVGIPPEEIPRLANFGFRALHPRVRRAFGAGFGLTKACCVARRLGGSLGIASALGVGTRVTLSIPRPSAAPA